MKNQVILLLAIGLIFSSCQKSDEEVENAQSTSTLLRSTATNVILPSYYELNQEVIQMSESWETFKVNPSEESLNVLKENLKRAWTSWQFCSPFDFGPALQVDLKSSLNTYPCDADLIDQSILNGDYSFVYDKWGFPALDYLFNGTNVDEVLNSLMENSRQTLVNTIINDIKSRTQNVFESWENDYADEWVSKTGNDAGSGLSLLVNSMVQDYESIKRNEIALPLGLLTLGIPLPEKTQSYYGGYSTELSLAHVQSTINAFTATHPVTSVDAHGLDDHLDEIQAEYNGLALSSVIVNELEEALQTLNQVPDPLSSTIETNPDIVETAYHELQEVVVYLKTDMPGVLGVSISFSDNDGD